jgi:hypothetical protein
MVREILTDEEQARRLAEEAAERNRLGPAGRVVDFGAGALRRGIEAVGAGIDLITPDQASPLDRSEPRRLIGPVAPPTVQSQRQSPLTALDTDDQLIIPSATPESQRLIAPNVLQPFSIAPGAQALEDDRREAVDLAPSIDLLEFGISALDLLDELVIVGADSLLTPVDIIAGRKVGNPEQRQGAEDARNALFGVLTGNVSIDEGIQTWLEDFRSRPAWQQIAGGLAGGILTGGVKTVIQGGARGTAAAARLVKTGLPGPSTVPVPKQAYQESFAKPFFGLGRVIKGVEGSAGVIVPNEVGARVIDLKPISTGLTAREVTQEWIMRPFNSLANRPPSQNAISSRVVEEMKRVEPKINSGSTAFGMEIEGIAIDIFDFDDFGGIPKLKGFDDTLVEAGVAVSPSLSDVAARYPKFFDYLSEAQKIGMRQIREAAKDYDDLQDAYKGTHHIRKDVLDGGGFFLSRGRALEEGVDNPIPFSGPRGKSGPSKPAAVFDSQAQGVAKGWRYSSIAESNSSHARSVGEDALQRYVGEYIKQVRDPFTGRPIAFTPLDRIDVVVRAQVRKLQGQIHSARQVINKNVGRETALLKETARRNRELGVVSGQASRASDRLATKAASQPDATAAAGFSEQSLKASKDEITSVTADALELAESAGKTERLLREAQGVLSKEDRAIFRLIDNLETTAQDADRALDKIFFGSPGVSDDAVQAAIKDQVALASVIEGKVDRILNSRKYQRIVDKVDDLTRRGKLLSDESAITRAELVGARTVLHNKVNNQLVLRGLDREYKMLERAQNTAARRSRDAGTRSEAQSARIDAQQERFNDLKSEYDTIKAQWSHAQRVAAKAPVNTKKKPDIASTEIALPSLQSYTVADEVASVINKHLSDMDDLQRRLRGDVIAPVRYAYAANTLYMAFKSTLDDSAPAIQGYLGLSRNPEMWRQAYVEHFKAFADPKVLSRATRTHDLAARADGMLTVRDMARHNLRVGGRETGFDIEKARIGNAPLIKQANQMFGAYGDLLRIKWMDREVRALVNKGRSIDDLRRSGDLDKIGDAISNATGWTNKRPAPNVADLVLFAPRFLAARIETSVRGVKGGAKFVVGKEAPVDQRIARRALAQAVGGATALTFLANWALGRETDTQLYVDGHVNSNFMRVRIGSADFGRDVSLLGTYGSLFTVMARIVNGEGVDAFRGLGSGLVANAWDFLSGETITGEPVGAEFITESGDFLRVDDPMRALERVMENFVPISASEAGGMGSTLYRAAFEGSAGDIAASAAAIPLEFGGMSSSPLTPKEKVDEAVRAWLRDHGDNRSLAQMKKEFPDELAEIKRNPDLEPYVDAMEEQRRRQNSDYQAYQDRRGEIYINHDTNLAQAARDIQVNRDKRNPDGIDPRGSNLRIIIDKHSRKRSEDLRLNRALHADALEFLENDDKPEGAFREALADYYNTLNGVDENGAPLMENGQPVPPLEDPVTLDYDTEARRDRITAVRSRHGDPMIDRVETHIRVLDHAFDTELREVRETLRPYFKLMDTVVIPTYQEQFPDKDVQAIFEKYRGMEVRDQQGYRDLVNAGAADPLPLNMLGTLSDIKTQFRESTPSVVASELAKLGVPLTANQIREMQTLLVLWYDLQPSEEERVNRAVELNERLMGGQ